MLHSIKRVLSLFLLPFSFIAANWGCSGSSENNSSSNYIVFDDGFSYRGNEVYSNPVPSSDSAQIGMHGFDGGFIFSFRGITRPGTYQFGEHNGIFVSYESYANTWKGCAQPGGSFVVTQLNNSRAFPAFEGTFKAIVIDTLPNYPDSLPLQIDTSSISGSFSIH